MFITYGESIKNLIRNGKRLVATFWTINVLENVRIYFYQVYVWNGRVSTNTKKAYLPKL